MYQIYVKNGYALKTIMHIQGLKSFAHAQVKYFLLMSTRQSFQKMKQKAT